MAGDQSLPLLSHSHHSAAPKSDSHEEEFDYNLPIYLLIVMASLLGVVLLLKLTFSVSKGPHFDLQEVGVEYLNYSVNAPTTAIVSLGIRILFSAENHNYFGLEYGPSTFNITYRGLPLGRATLPGFYLDYDHVKRVQTTVAVDRVNLDDAADFVRDASLNDRVELQIMGDVNVNMLTKSWFGTSTTATTVSTNCVITISPRKQALTSKLCGSLML